MDFIFISLICLGFLCIQHWYIFLAGAVIGIVAYCVGYRDFGLCVGIPCAIFATIGLCMMWLFSHMNQ